MSQYVIRDIRSDEIPLLSDFLYESIFQRDENNLVPRDIINKPKFRLYIDNFGQPDDNCLVVECDGKVIGAVWTRIINGYGSVDDQTPEFAISLYKEYRNKGIGTDLMQRMLELLKEKGYKQASLSAQKDNYAVKMYRKVGFEVLIEKEEEYIMIYKLNEI